MATLDDAGDPDDGPALAVAIARLVTANPEVAEVVRLRFYAGLSVEQTAAALHLSVSTVKRKWLYARAWLYRKLTAGGPEPTA